MKEEAALTATTVLSVSFHKWNESGCMVRVKISHESEQPNPLVFGVLDPHRSVVLGHQCNPSHLSIPLDSTRAWCYVPGDTIGSRR